MPAVTTAEELSPEPRPVRRAWRRHAALWLGALGIYWLVLFAATHTPNVRSVGPVLDYDKLLHGGAYFVLATLLLIAWRRTGVRTTWRARIAVVMLAMAYGAVDEVTQPYFGRDCSLLDWLADGAGVGLAIAIDAWRHRRDRS